MFSSLDADEREQLRDAAAQDARRAAPAARGAGRDRVSDYTLIHADDVEDHYEGTTSPASSAA